MRTCWWWLTFWFCNIVSQRCSDSNNKEIFNPKKNYRKVFFCCQKKMTLKNLRLQGWSKKNNRKNVMSGASFSFSPLWSAFFDKWQLQFKLLRGSFKSIMTKCVALFLCYYFVQWQKGTIIDCLFLWGFSSVCFSSVIEKWLDSCLTSVSFTLGGVFLGFDTWRMTRWQGESFWINLKWWDENLHEL